MKCLKDINKRFLLNEKCKMEIEGMMKSFPEALLNVDYYTSQTFVTKFHGIDNNVYEAVAELMDKKANVHYVQYTKKDSNDEVISQLSITVDSIAYLNNSKTKLSSREVVKQKKKIIYALTDEGFQRDFSQETLNMSQSRNGGLSFVEKNEFEEANDYIMVGERAVEMNRLENENQYIDQYTQVLNTINKTINCKRYLKNPKLIIVERENEAFLSQTSSESIPVYSELVKNKMKTLTDNEKKKLLDNNIKAQKVKKN